MDKYPHFTNFRYEYLEFQAIKDIAERIMREASIENQITDSNKILNIKIRSPFKMSLIEIQNFITEIYIHPIKKEYFYQILSIFKSRSWSYIASLEKPKTLSAAESILKQAAYLDLE